MPDYTSVKALRAYANFMTSHEDSVLVGFIQAASQVIDNHCHRTFSASTTAAHVFTKRTSHFAGQVDPFDGQLLLLDDDLAEAAASITGTPTVSYLPLYKPPYWGIVNEDGSWSSPITVTGYWAYSKEPPIVIQDVCLRLAKWLWELRDTTRGDAVVVTDQGAVLLPAALPADVVTLLGPYVRRYVR